MSEHGRIIAVTERPLGSTLVGDTAAGATTLTVVDAAEFDDQSSGWLSVNGQIIQYTSVDDDTGVITLASGAVLSAAADEGDAVLLYDQLYQTIAVDKRADVVLDGADDNTDAIDAGIALHLVDKIDTGVRGDTGESVILEEEAGDWKIIDVLGLGSPNATGVQFEEDSYTVTTAGDQVFRLSHEPKEHSEHLYWNGLYQPGSEWTRDGQAVTVPDPDGVLEVGDELTVEYAYLVAVKDSTTLVDWQATGWAHLQVASTDTTDRSAPGFDDSAWAKDAAAFARNLGQQHPYGYPGASTVWDVGTRLWIRRSVSVPADATEIMISVRVDDTADVYWNGNLLGSCTSDINGQTLFTFQPMSWQDNNTLAVRGTDSPPGDPTAPANWTYLDVSVISEGS